MAHRGGTADKNAAAGRDREDGEPSTVGTMRTTACKQLRACTQCTYPSIPSAHDAGRVGIAAALDGFQQPARKTAEGKETAGLVRSQEREVTLIIARARSATGLQNSNSVGTALGPVRRATVPLPSPRS
jgi:hypothetical protein